MKEQFKEMASLIGEPVRATILWTLLDGRAFTATELSIMADTSASNISMHLAKLVNAGLLKAESQGRHRYYTLSGPETAYAVEALAALNLTNAKNKTTHEDLPPIKQCRTCYDHLAGKTAITITDALLKQKLMINADGAFQLTANGTKWFSGLGIKVDELLVLRRSFLRPCLDWSERRYHIAGSLAAALLNKMLKEDWIRKTKTSRAVVITGKGQKKLYEFLKIVV